MKFSDFGFKENPFSITPDPRYLFLSRGHEESLAHLIYGTGPNGGFVLLTGEVGTGKTMLVRSLLAQKLEDVEIALILNPRLSPLDFIATICDELRINYQEATASIKQLSDVLTRHLLKTHAQGRHTVLVVDEAQNLSPDVLEQVRLLTNLETAKHKLLRIILVGQPELRDLLARDDLRQVDQRITARYHLSPLSRTETANYIRHRLAVAGIQSELFSPAALSLIHRLTQGVPRLINTLCERTLLAIFATDAQQVGLRLVWRASREIRGQYLANRQWRWLLFIGLLLAVVFSGWWFMPQKVELSIAQPVVQREPSMMELDVLPQPEDIPLFPSADPEPVIPEQDQAAVDLETEDMLQTTAAEEQSTASITTPSLIQEQILEQEPVQEQELEQEQEREALTVHQRLFALWGKTVDPGVERDFCAVARQHNLRCLRDSADWTSLRQLNRPVLLKLVKQTSASHILLKHWQGDQLVIHDGADEQVISPDEFLPFWKGDFVMLWRPLTEVTLIGTRSTGSAVTWLRKRLSLADGMPLPAIVGLDRFDAELKARLEQFQRKNELVADGIAGPHTMIHLNSLLLPANTPTLTE